jgi:cell division protein FtsZ
VRSITDLMVMPGLINLDFADVRSVMSEMGKAMMGTGEGEGENRALDAAEQAIANPLLDGVSMAGAKGVIISIIGGEDMRLLEVDEAANHIRELVDEDANIIWGSAFNPDLKGKIRVSVVATGIEQSAIGQSERSQPISLGAMRAPKRPVLELSEDEGLAELPPIAPQPEPEPEPEAAPAPEPMAYEPPVAEPYADDPYEDDTLDLGGMDEGEEDEDEDEEAEVAASAPFELTGMQPGDDYGDEYEDDVDDIVDPLAGLRGADGGLADSGLAGGGLSGFGQTGGAASPPAGDDGMLDLGESGYGSYDPAGQGDGGDDDLLASADRLAAEDGPVQPRAGGGRRRPLLGGAGGEGGGGGGGGAGSTLFERMANLSRSTARDDDEDDDDGDDGDGGPALSIPRFLGRQNNQ